MSRSSCVFLLSPAYCGGRRATYLLRAGSTLPLAQRLAAGTLTLGDAFQFMSGLYFRGKLAYARAFGRLAPLGAGGPGGPPSGAGLCRPVHVITPTRGLMSPDELVSADRLREFAAVDVRADDTRYRGPLDRDLAALAALLPPDGRVVLLGSIATGKYIDAMTAILGARLHFPSAFVGRGDMSRGGLLLRQVEEGCELDYTPFVADVVRHGARPPKLPPLARPLRLGLLKG